MQENQNEGEDRAELFKTGNEIGHGRNGEQTRAKDEDFVGAAETYLLARRAATAEYGKDHPGGQGDAPQARSSHKANRGQHTKTEKFKNV